MTFLASTTQTKLSVLMCGFATALVAYATWSHNVLTETGIHGPHYAAIASGKDLLSDVRPTSAHIIESHLLTLNMVRAAERGVDAEAWAPMLDRCQRLKNDFEARRSFWANEELPEEVKVGLLGDAAKFAAQYFEIRDKEFIPACLSGNVDAARRLAFGDLQRAYDQHRSSIDKVVVSSQARNAQIEWEVSQLIADRTQWSIVMLVCIISGTLLFGWSTLRQYNIAAAAQAKAQIDFVSRYRLQHRCFAAGVPQEQRRLLALLRPMREPSPRASQLCRQQFDLLLVSLLQRRVSRQPQPTTS